MKRSEPQQSHEDSDDSDDSDYKPQVPSLPGDIPIDDERKPASVGAMDVLRTNRVKRQRKERVDDIWQELKAADERALSAALNRRVEAAPASDCMTLKQEITKQRAHATLSSIFGSNTAASIVYGRLAAAAPANGVRGPSSTSRISNPPAVPESKTPNLLTTRPQTVTEKRRFAGREIEYTRKLEDNEQLPAASASGLKAAKSGLEGVLQDLKGPESISTVAKSSHDWDTFKTEKGLEDQLAKASKDGYLHRKEFLDRVDYRQFEHERDARNVARAAAAAAADRPKGGQ